MKLSKEELATLKAEKENTNELLMNPPKNMDRLEYGIWQHSKGLSLEECLLLCGYENPEVQLDKFTMKRAKRLHMKYRTYWKARALDLMERNNPEMWAKYIIALNKGCVQEWLFIEQVRELLGEKAAKKVANIL